MKRVISGIALALALLVPASPALAASDHVVFAGGCFWGMQAVFESVKGVQRVVAGFSGGSAATAHYDIVSTGDTGHAESVDITYDPSQISFEKLLDVYFLVAHDPTQLNYQGPDQGTQYRSEIFYTSDAQHAQAAAYIASLQRRHVFHAPVVTKLEPLHKFYAAEAYHQDYLVHNPDSPYIVFNDMPKLRTLKAKYPALVKNDAAPMKVLAGR